MNDPGERLEALLRDGAVVEDGGFTASVMGALPPRRAGRREAVLLAAGVCAALVGALALGEPVRAAAVELAAGGVPMAMLVGAAVATLAGLAAGRVRDEGAGWSR